MSIDKMEWISAKKLISPQRFDLMAKYTYVEHKDKKYETVFAKELYTKHIEAFSGGTYKEPGNDLKNSAKAYVSMFDDIIESIREDGVIPEKSVIPVSEDGTITDGAHRTATAAYYDLMIPCERDQVSPVYNYEFFRKMYLDEFYCDYIATKYIEVSEKDVAMFILWPVAIADKQKYAKAMEVIRSNADGKIVYEKKIHITYNGIRSFMIQAYAKHDWVGNYKNHYRGIEGKVDPCFSDNETIHVYAIEKSFTEVTSLKEKVRELYGIGNHSCHSTDTKEESIEMAHLLFNQNSVHLMNYGRLDWDSTLVPRVFNFKNTLLEKGHSLENYIIDSSSVLGLYAIRKPEDIDYMTIESGDNDFGFDNHHDYIGYYGMSIAELVLNPRNYLYAFGMKFITLDVLRNFKKARGEEKDKEDILLIERKLEHSSALKDKLSCEWICIKRKFRNQKSAIRDWLQSHNIYFLTKLWHLLVGKGFK